MVKAMLTLEDEVKLRCLFVDLGRATVRQIDLQSDP
jgi:hypothetical protein